ncbi:MAG TPA: flagellar biosynthesis anti-sigma factor FlgM [Bryobacteraceae bacterium]|nr:flagellar biosynthesis anti-sigma factor FlgM [Bryobacteraceae bacterium]
MKVTDSAITNAQASRVESPTPNTGPGGARRTGSAGDAGDRVDISTLSGRLLSSLDMDGPERAARLEQLSALVKSGRYQPDAPAISRKIVDEALGPEA